MAMLYPNLCYNAVCYKKVSLYCKKFLPIAQSGQHRPGSAVC